MKFALIILSFLFLIFNLSIFELIQFCYMVAFFLLNFVKCSFKFIELAVDAKSDCDIVITFLRSSHGHIIIRLILLSWNWRLFNNEIIVHYFFFPCIDGISENFDILSATFNLPCDLCHFFFPIPSIYLSLKCLLFVIQ